jgi:hypothetical protein
LPWQTPERYHSILKMAHLGVIFQGRNASRLSLPSKLFDYVSTGLPLLCFAETDSDLYSFVTEKGLGSCFSKGEDEPLYEHVLHLSSSNQSDYASLREYVKKQSSGYSFRQENLSIVV